MTMSDPPHTGEHAVSPDLDVGRRLNSVFYRESVAVRAERERSGAHGPSPLQRDLDVDPDELVARCFRRCRQISDENSVRFVASRAGVNHETARRYIQGDAITAIALKLIIGVVREFGLSADWLLFGTGPVFLKDLPDSMLKERSSAELLSSLAKRIGAIEREIVQRAREPELEEPCSAGHTTASAPARPADDPGSPQITINAKAPKRVKAKKRLPPDMR